MDTFYILFFFFFPLSLSLLFHYCYYWKRGVWKRSVTWAYRKFAMRPHPKCICQTKENLYDTEIIVTTEMNKNNTILQVVRYWQTSATKSKHFRWTKERTTYSLKFINVWVCCWVNMCYPGHVIAYTHNKAISHAWEIAIKYSGGVLYSHNWFSYISCLFARLCIR